MDEAIHPLLRDLAGKYLWWKTPDEALRRPERIIAQVMNLGDYDDAHAMATALGDGALRTTLAQAEIGWFNERSWAYWRLRLGLPEAPLPKDRFVSP